MAKQKIVLGVTIIILAVLVAYLLVERNSQEKGNSQTNSTEDQVKKLNPMQAQIPVDLTVEQKVELKAGADEHAQTELTFHITGGSFYFTPNEIKVRQGDKVKIIFTNVLGTHNLTFVDFGGLGTKTIKDGESDTIEFTADKKGTFEFYCSVGNGYHRTKGQIGVLLVQ